MSNDILWFKYRIYLKCFRSIFGSNKHQNWATKFLCIYLSNAEELLHIPHHQLARWSCSRWSCRAFNIARRERTSQVFDIVLQFASDRLALSRVVSTEWIHRQNMLTPKTAISNALVCKIKLLRYEWHHRPLLQKENDWSFLEVK